MARPDYLEWLRFARDDLETAEFLLGMSPRKIEIICYHCQQCAEKALKAVLALLGDEIIAIENANEGFQFKLEIKDRSEDL